MDRQLGTVVSYDRHDLNQFGAARRPEVEPRIVVLVVDRHGVFGGMLDVLVGDSVFPRRWVDIHFGIVLRNHRLAAYFRSCDANPQLVSGNSSRTLGQTTDKAPEVRGAGWRKDAELSTNGPCCPERDLAVARHRRAEVTAMLPQVV